VELFSWLIWDFQKSTSKKMGSIFNTEMTDRSKAPRDIPVLTVTLESSKVEETIWKVSFTCWYIFWRGNFLGKILSKMRTTTVTKKFFRRNSQSRLRTCVTGCLISSKTLFNIREGSTLLKSRTMNLSRTSWNKPFLMLADEFYLTIYIVGKKVKTRFPSTWSQV